MADSDLISRAAGGDPAAFQALVERHRSMVYRVAYQFAGNHYDAEDIAQDVFIKVYRSLVLRRLAKRPSIACRTRPKRGPGLRRTPTPASSATCSSRRSPGCRKGSASCS